MKFEMKRRPKEFKDISLYSLFVCLYEGDEYLYVKTHIEEAHRLEVKDTSIDESVLSLKESRFTFHPSSPCFPVIDIPTIVY